MLFRSQSLNFRSVGSYLAGFRVIQDELAGLGNEMKLLIETQSKQDYRKLAEEVRKLSLNTDQIIEDNKIIQNEHAELFHSLNVLGNINRK